MDTHLGPRLLTVLICTILWAIPSLTQAKTVRCRSGDAACLIAAIQAANASGQDNTIRLEAGNYVLTGPDNNTDGNNGLPSITGTLTIRGVGNAWNQTVITGPQRAPGFRLFHVAASGNLTLQGLAVANGGGQVQGGGILSRGTLSLVQSAIDQSVGDPGGGLANLGGTVTIEESYFFENVTSHTAGGIYSQGGSVTIMQSTLVKNNGDGGGAIDTFDTNLVIVDSTIIDNGVLVMGGGGISIRGGTAQIVNTTIARNIGSDFAGAIEGRGDIHVTNSTIVDNQVGRGTTHGVGGILAGATVTLVNTILARNGGSSVPENGTDCRGTIISAGSNLIGDPQHCPTAPAGAPLDGQTIALQPTDKIGDPGLGPFTDNGQAGGGYYPLLPTSQAINAGDPQACPLKDQLGQPRQGVCDLGSVEFQGAAVAAARPRR